MSARPHQLKEKKEQLKTRQQSNDILALLLSPSISSSMHASRHISLNIQK
jgi:hypothetical protein